MSGNIQIPEFTKQDYLATTAPFEFILNNSSNPFEQQQLLSLVAEKAKSTSVRNFKNLFNSYLKTVNASNGIMETNVTDFEGLDQEFKCGQYVCDQFGVSFVSPFGMEIIACNHPIVPVERFVNIDTNIEKIRLAYQKGGMWRYITVDKEILASATKIVQLANYGVGVNSENAKYLVKYLTDMEQMNYHEIPERNSVERLGWIENHGFSPYVDNLFFDGELSFHDLFNTVKSKGSFEAWLKAVREVRQKEHTVAKIMLAASFASALVAPCNALPFFVHLWGGSENGKSVAMILGASVWANPAIGEYVKSFNSTEVSQELTAAFLNSLPLCLDELQIESGARDFDKLIYKLAEGVSRGRGKKSGGLQKMSKWRNCVLTTGEFPILNEHAGGGAVNRVIEINCANFKVFENSREVFLAVSQNYGFAGKMFVHFLQEDANMEKVLKKQEEILTELTKTEATEKQALAASLILTADYFATELIFKDGNQLQVSDIAPYLSTKTQVSPNFRCLQYILDTVSMNPDRFDAEETKPRPGEIWGKETENEIHIIKTKFDSILRDGGYNPTVFLEWAKDNKVIRTDKSGKTCVTTRILDKVARCVAIKRYNPFNDAENDGFEVELLP